MVTLFVIYLSFSSGLVTHDQYLVPAQECEERKVSIQQRVKAGRVWAHCIKGTFNDDAGR